MELTFVNLLTLIFPRTGRVGLQTCGTLFSPASLPVTQKFSL